MDRSNVKEIKSPNEDLFKSCNKPVFDTMLNIDSTLKKPLAFQHIENITLETIEENNAFKDEILRLYKALELKPDSMPDDIKQNLEKISTILRTEELSKVNLLELKIRMQNKVMNERKVQHRNKILALKYDNVYIKYVTYENKLRNLKDSVEAISNMVAGLYEKDIDSHSEKVLLYRKVTDYENALEELDRELESMEVEEVYPENILKKYNQCLELKGELTDIDNALDKYEDLPPNLLQAKDALNAKKKEYNKIEDHFMKLTHS